jgi:uncharacterized lipoprotein YddW (UPF0748 family)
MLFIEFLSSYRLVSITALLLWMMLVLDPVHLLAQLSAASAPKRELRGVWIASVSNIDWPVRSSDTPEKQRSDFIAIIEAHRAMGANAVFVQVRPTADALYAKSREPWSQVLTGMQGRAPVPLWDPLEFMIAETHKRGMEFHAWFNPFRSVASSTSVVASNHISVLRPDWHLTYSNPFKLLDPGNPEVRDYVVSVVMDVVRGYDIDGVHFDDYFYPYSGTTNQDAATFQRFSRGFTNINDWRRDNVNVFVRQMQDSINAAKPRIKFGISPFGIWKSGTPPGIVGLDAFSVIYCDALAWLQERTVDYLIPQLYWRFGGGQDYARLMPWWLEQARLAGRHLYTGLAAYRLRAADGDWSVADVTSQVDFNRTTNQMNNGAGPHGAVFFSSNQLTSDLKGLQTSLRMSQFSTPALPPTMPWKDNIPPLPPVNVRATRQFDAPTLVRVSWSPSLPASDGESARAYIVYRFAMGDSLNLNDARAIRGIVPALSTNASLSFTEQNVDNTRQFVYVVTAVDRLWNESQPAAPAALVREVSVRQSAAEIVLDEPSPNPASDQTTITFTVHEPCLAEYVVYDLLGREVWRAWNGGGKRLLPAGVYREVLEVHHLPPGVYLGRLTLGASITTHRIVVQR